MQIVSGKEKGYEDWKAKQSDAYGRRCFTYAEEWAALMEAEIARGRTVAECAQVTSLKADYDGITGFMYGMAVAILAFSWVHGDELRRWHNLDVQIGDEGERANASGGVLDPAMLTVGRG